MNSKHDDHKVKWVERMLGACVPGGSYCDPQRVADAIREYCAALTEAPAASEGEDGAVALSWLDDVLGRMKGQLRSSDAAFDWKVVRDYHADLCRVRSNLTRPAAQAADNPSASTKHDEGRKTVRHVRHVGGGMLALYDGDVLVREIGTTSFWDFRDRDEFIARYNSYALATQPAANVANATEAKLPCRVTEQDVERARTAYHAAAGNGQEDCPSCHGTGRQRDNYTECSTCEGARWVWKEGSPDPIRAALESFAHSGAGSSPTSQDVAAEGVR